MRTVSRKAKQDVSLNIHSEALDIGREVGLLFDAVNRRERGAMGGEMVIKMQLRRVMDECIDMEQKMELAARTA
ncbi:MAG: hypothetical protein JNL32_03650 [Candidatus Kapabacteria bacterium]|nr:hypothetical protein [Candidatus Kapabacteria bacterium]